MKFRSWLSFRWVLFVVALAGVVVLTMLNIFSLNNLREQDAAEVDRARRNQLFEFANNVRSRFYDPVKPFWTMDSDSLNTALAQGVFPSRMLADLQKTARFDSLFTDVYFTTPDCTPCDAGVRIQHFNPEKGDFEWQTSYPEIVCDGIGLARTQMKVIVQDYKWNTRTFFDEDRSMTIVFVDNRIGEISGYLLFRINREYLINRVIVPAIVSEFGTNPDDGITVWVHDWARKEIVAASDSRFAFDMNAIRIIERFPGLLENWNVKARYDQTAAVALSNASLTRHMVVLVFSALLLIGSFLVIFVIAQRERALALRQAGFLANVTHELKTPIAVMQAAGENLADGRVNDERRLRNYGKHIYDEAVRLRGMIDKLLDVAKSDAGQLVAKRKPITAARVLSDFIELHKPYWESIGFTVLFKSNARSAVINVDPSHLDTILSSLTDNAIKYSLEEKVLDFSVERLKSELLISVTDRGRGIPPHAQKHVFEKFYRVEDALTADTKGHGLGLAIVKNLVTLNDGRVSLKSSVGKGSTFTIHFPVAGIQESRNIPEIQTQHHYVAQG